MSRGTCMSVAVVAVLCCLLSRGVCQDKTDVNKGCFYDGDGDKADRVLTDLIDCSGSGGRAADVCQGSCGPTEAYCESNSGMTIGICRTLCRAGNFQYYGMQTGSQCFCGGAFANPTIHGFAPSEANCSETCTGNVSQTCGGEFRLRVYEFQDPIVTPGCFFPASVPYATVVDVSVGVGETLTFTCQPRYELVGNPSLTCVSNRTWSPMDVPICNYTGIVPETTTETPTTTVETTAIPATTSRVPSTESSRTTQGERTTIGSHETTTDSRPPAPGTTDRPVKATTVRPVKPTTDRPVKPTTVRPVKPSTDRPVKPTTEAQKTITDYLPYMIGGAVALAILLVICIIIILSCRVRKRSGGGTQDIRLKPDDVGPVTFLNRGYVGSDEPEMQDVRLTVGDYPTAVENEYATQGAGLDDQDDDRHDDDLVKPGGTERNPETEPISPRHELMPNPIYESSNPASPNGDAAAPEPSPNVFANVAPTEDLDTASDGATSYEDVTSGKIKWNSQENLLSDSDQENSSRL